MAIKIGSLLLCGVALSGKSTLGKFLASLLNPMGTSKKVVCIDVSDMIKWGKKIEGGIGDEVRKHKSIMDGGGFLPDHAMIPLFYEWLAMFCKENPSVETLIICGAPRTLKQLELLSAFNHSLVVNINTSFEMAAADLKRRIAESGTNVRADDLRGLAGLKERYKKHEELTLPAIKKLGNAVLHLDRSVPLCERIEQTFTRLMQMNGKSPIEQQLVSEAIGRFHKDHQGISDLYPSVKFPPDPFYLARRDIELPRVSTDPDQHSSFVHFQEVLVEQRMRH